FADSFRLYDQVEDTVHYDRAHNTWLENAFELGLPAALALFLALIGLALTCLRGVRRRHRDWVFPATGVAASVLVGIHATVDFSLQLPAVAMLYAAIMGVACAQSYSSVEP
ncbi:O-antigen ligase domain-containing protein, partial [Pseudomonadota bacterium]